MRTTLSQFSFGRRRYVIDRDGKIAAAHVGLVGKSDYQAEIETLLGKKAPAALVDSSFPASR